MVYYSKSARTGKSKVTVAGKTRAYSRFSAGKRKWRSRLRFKNKVRKAILGISESKYSNEYSTGVSVDNTAKFADLTDAIAQGDTVVTREGDNIQLSCMYGKAEIVVKSGAATGTINNVRHIIFMWHPDDAIDAPDNMNKILADTTNIPYLSPFVSNKIQRAKFTVLHDRNHILGTRTDGGAPCSKHEKFSFNLSNLPETVFNATATTGRHKIYQMVLGNQATVADQALITWQYVLRFKDF